MASKNLKEYTKLKVRVDELQREVDMAAGALEEQMRRLKKEFGCNTIKQARALLEQLEQEAQDAERDFQQGLAAFRAKHKNVL